MASSLSSTGSDCLSAIFAMLPAPFQPSGTLRKMTDDVVHTHDVAPDDIADALLLDARQSECNDHQVLDQLGRTLLPPSCPRHFPSFIQPVSSPLALEPAF